MLTVCMRVCALITAKNTENVTRSFDTHTHMCAVLRWFSFYSFCLSFFFFFLFLFFLMLFLFFSTFCLEFVYVDVWCSWCWSDISFIILIPILRYLLRICSNTKIKSGPVNLCSVHSRPPCCLLPLARLLVHLPDCLLSLLLSFASLSNVSNLSLWP